MQNLTKYTINNTRVAIAFMVLIIIMGLGSYKKIPKRQDPGFVVRSAQITTLFPGASPDRIENLITDPIEEVIQEIPELDFIESQSRTGLSIILVRIQERYKNMRPIWDALRRKVNRVSNKLPKGVVGPFINDEFGDVFGTVITITGDGYSYKELKEVASRTRSQLLRMENIAKVDYYGEQKERIYIEYHDAKLAEFGTSAIQLQQFMESRNIITPGGAVVTDKERIFLEPTGNFVTIEDLKNTVVVIPGTEHVMYLRDIADVKRGYEDPPTQAVSSSGYPSIALAISLNEGGNISQLGEDVKALIKELEQKYPLGVQFDIIAYQAGEVDQKINEFVSSLIQSMLIVLAMMLFFFGLRTGFIVASLIPMTILMSFIIMNQLEITMNQISLAALIIALGMLVDNAIVMTESIIIEVSNGKLPKQAALDSVQELRIPLLTSSLTTSAAFLPIFLAKSTAGEYTSSLFTVVTIALMSSWILSLTMIPMLCVQFLSTQNKLNKKKESPFLKKYRSFLHWTLKRPYKMMLVFVLLFVLSIYSFKFIKKSFFPNSDRPLFTGYVELPVGTKIERTQEVVAEIEEYIQTNLLANEELEKDGITNWASFTGGNAPRYVLNFAPIGNVPHNVFLMLNTNTHEVIPQLIEKLEIFTTKTFPEATISLKPTEHGPAVKAPVAVRVSGTDTDTLLRIANKIKNKMREDPNFKNIHDDWGDKSKKIVIEIDQTKALRAGLTSSDVAISLQTGLSGFQPTEFREDDNVIPVIVRSTEGDREDLDKLETVSIYSQSSDKRVPLKQIADLKIQWQADTIHRRNLAKTITVKAGVNRVKTTPVEETMKLIPWLDEQKEDWPFGYFYEVGGEYEESTKSDKSIGVQLPIAGMIIVLLLIMQFNSFRLPLIICLTIPLGIIGVAFGLLITRGEFGFMAFLGIISLSGIVINNAIVLLDRITIEKGAGKNMQEAVLDASERRIRPIFLTTLTTIGGLLPLIFGGDAMFQYMGIAIVFGLAFATCLTLVFVPIMYAILYRVKF